MVSVGLLDVNMLIALAWPLHVHHETAETWFIANGSYGWATCPMTEAAFVRISCNPRILPEAVAPSAAVLMLETLVANEYHEFWPDAISVRTAMGHAGHISGHNQITDAYLLGLAMAQHGKLVTLDRALAALLPDKYGEGEFLEIVGHGRD